MTNERWNTVTDLFHRVRKLPAAERRPFLEQQCCDDPEMMAEVESLLAHDGETFLGSPDFLERSGRAAPRTLTGGGAGWSESGPHPESFSGQRYLVQRLLGEGGQKQVFLARDSGLEREVVVAVLRQNCWDPANLARIRREARTMARLDDHPHIVSIYDFAEEDGQPFFVTQYVDGGSVADLLRSSDGAHMPIEKAVRIAEETSQALDHAHGQVIVQRDIKPANVLLTPEGTVKLGDFGLASSLDQSQLTQTGAALGTATYMSPEHALGSDVGPLSDLYSLGAMLYEMVTGAPPFRGDSVLSVAAVPGRQRPLGHLAAPQHRADRAIAKEPGHSGRAGHDHPSATRQTRR